jgi:hypothetical protein
MASLWGCVPQEAADGVTASGEPSIVRQIDRPLLPEVDEEGGRAFRDGFVRGILTASGRWEVRGEIAHPRLRCASYQLGLRFGIGDEGCAVVDWQTGAAFLPSRMQCNNAMVIHSGEGSIGLSPAEVSALNCVRVMVRCTGACG